MLYSERAPIFRSKFAHLFDLSCLKHATSLLKSKLHSQTHGLAMFLLLLHTQFQPDMQIFLADPAKPGAALQTPLSIY